MLDTLRVLLTVCVLTSTSALGAAGQTQDDQILVNIADQDIDISRFLPAQKTSRDELIIWLSPGFGNTERSFALARQLRDTGIEIWYTDLAQSLFLERSTHTLRTLDPIYVAELIERAHHTTGKRITLLSRAYGAIPLLRGARLWQQRNQQKEALYLNGAILFSPELFSKVPALGEAAEYMPIVSATNIPVMLYQAGNRGNRWQLPDVIARLEQGGAPVTVKVMPGVTGVFYHEDTAQETLELLARLPGEIPRMINLLGKIPIDTSLPTMEEIEIERRPLDFELSLFTAEMEPLPLSLPDTEGELFVRNEYLDRVTVINFWASWCTPCVEEIPALNNLRDQMANDAFELISINYAEDAERVQTFLEMVKVDFPVLLDESGQVSANWRVLVYPATFVIGPDGRIVYGVNGAIHWDAPEVIARLRQLSRQRRIQN